MRAGVRARVGRYYTHGAGSVGIIIVLLRIVRRLHIPLVPRRVALSYELPMEHSYLRTMEESASLCADRYVFSSVYRDQSDTQKFCRPVTKLKQHTHERNQKGT